MVDEIIETENGGTADGVRYWLYAPGYNASEWEKFYRDGIMSINWGGLGNLTAYSSKEEMRLKIKEVYNEPKSCKNDALCNWQFVNDLKPGDIVFAKKGRNKIIGRGVVTGEYELVTYDSTEYFHVRKVNWTHKGEWGLPEGLSVKALAMKTLTDITRFPNLVEKLSSMFAPPEEEQGMEEFSGEEYTRENFLEDVYIDGSDYDKIIKKLRHKKNIILQGPPGVGKTFSAERLAYSMMGEMDDSRIKFVQFHQSYGYEDFIMGFRPTENGFKLTEGAFYRFCELARNDSKRDYFFIIDEINRGNLSKIFGELFVLIEGERRGEAVRLLYRDEDFTVPANLYIIGMMNTADRSLAIMDFALRRRFAFYEFKPAFSSEGFKRDMLSDGNGKLEKVIEVIERLNREISEDDSLGRGFCIGHSYFCSGGQTADDEWLRSVVEFEIVPLLEEYWFDEPSKWQRWENALNEAMR